MPNLVTITRNAIPHSTIILRWLNIEIDFIQDAVPGDVIFILPQSPHKNFTRKGNDLAMRLEINLEEATLSGFQRTITHLDGRKVTLVVDASEIKKYPIQKGSLRVVPECGMPTRGRPGQYGDLYIEFDVSIPLNFSRLSDDERTQLAALMSKAAGKENEKKMSSNETTNNKEVRHLKTGSASNFGKGNILPDDQSFIDEDEFYEDDEHQFNPFAGNSFGGYGRSFSYGSNFGESMGGNDKH